MKIRMHPTSKPISVRRLLEELQNSFYEGGLTISEILKSLSIPGNVENKRSEQLKNLIEFLRKGAFIEISDFDKKSLEAWLNKTKTVGKAGSFLDHNNMRINISTKGMEYLTLLKFNERADRSTGIMLMFTVVLISIAFIQILDAPSQNISYIVWAIAIADVLILIFSVFSMWDSIAGLFHRS